MYPSWIDKNSLLQQGLDLEYWRAKTEAIMNRLGEKHLSWWEHKGSNQCQICDMLVGMTVLLEEIDILNTTKSSLDSMTEIDYQYNSVLDQEPSGVVGG